MEKKKNETLTYFSVSLDDKNLEPDPHQLEKWDPDLHRNVLIRHTA